MALQFVILLSVSTLVAAQRPFFAGTRPIGYPTTVTTTTTVDSLGNRFGENNATTTTQRLPIEALGDRDLVDRLSKLPKDKQPFWLLNWQALEEMRKNPQTYPQRPSHFNQPLNPSFVGNVDPSNNSPSVANAPSVVSNSQFSSGASGFVTGNTNTANNNFGATNSGAANSGATNIDTAPLFTNQVNVIPNPTTTSGLGNRFGNDNTNFETTRLTPVPVLTPTYPIYAHVDDVLANNYVPSQNSQSGSLLNEPRLKSTDSNNKLANRNLANEDTTSFDDAGVFYAPSLSMFRQPILYSSFSNVMAKPFDLQSENF